MVTATNNLLINLQNQTASDVTLPASTQIPQTPQPAKVNADLNLPKTNSTDAPKTAPKADTFESSTVKTAQSSEAPEAPVSQPQKTQSPTAEPKNDPKNKLRKNIQKGLLIAAGVGLFAAAFINTKVSIQKAKELETQLAQKLKNFECALSYIEIEAKQARQDSLEKISKIYKEAMKPLKKGELKELEQKLHNINSFEDANAFKDVVEEFLQTKFGEYADDPMFQKLFEKGEKIANAFAEKILKKQAQVIASFEKESSVNKLTAGLLHDERCFKALVDYQNKMRAKLELSQSSYSDMKVGLHNENRKFMAHFANRALKVVQKTNEIKENAKEAIRILDPKNDPLKDLLGGLGIRRA